jgi:hypothetical protein
MTAGPSSSESHAPLRMPIHDSEPVRVQTLHCMKLSFTTPCRFLPANEIRHLKLQTLISLLTAPFSLVDFIGILLLIAQLYGAFGAVAVFGAIAAVGACAVFGAVAAVGTEPVVIDSV